jgi:hypothetical protein
LNSDCCDANTEYYQLYYFPLDPILVIGIYYSFIIFLFFSFFSWFGLSFCCVTLQVTQTKGYSFNFDLTGQNTKKQAKLLFPVGESRSFFFSATQKRRIMIFNIRDAKLYLLIIKIKILQIVFYFIVFL